MAEQEILFCHLFFHKVSGTINIRTYKRGDNVNITQQHQEQVYHYTFDEYKQVKAYGHEILFHSFRVVIRIDRPLSSHIVFTDTENNEYFFGFQDYYMENPDEITALGQKCLDYHIENGSKVTNIPLASEIIKHKHITQHNL